MVAELNKFGANLLFANSILMHVALKWERADYDLNNSREANARGKALCCCSSFHHPLPPPPPPPAPDTKKVALKPEPVRNGTRV